MAGGLGLADLLGPFQPQLFYDKLVMGKCVENT